MRILILTLTVLIAATGCARLKVEGSKEPIKVDISMRLDVYQHVEKDIDAIENIVSGSAVEPQSKVFESITGFFVGEAYAADGLSPQVEAAALRRKDRLLALTSAQSQGIIGENKSALVEIMSPEGADSSMQDLVEAENSDRMAIYQALAGKNGTSVAEVQTLYAKRLQDSAPDGTPIQTSSGQWMTK